MPRARPDYRDPPASVVPVQFNEATVKRLGEICPDPAFARRLGVVAGFYREACKVGEPSEAAVVKTIDDLNRRASDLHALLGKLPFRVYLALQAGDLSAGVSERSPDALKRSLWLFMSSIKHAKLRLHGRRGPRVHSVERVAAEWVRKLFTAHNLPFRLADDRRARNPGPAAFCLRLVLGLPDSQRVEHYLRSSKTSTK